MKNNEIEERRLKIMPRGASVMCNFYVQKAENATIWDEEGNAYIDFTCGIAVLNTGHNHPTIKQAIQKQLDSFTHTAFQIVPYEIYISLAERISKLVPIKGDKKTIFFSTGAEAVENAIKIARSYTGRSGLLAFSGSFHGRTHMGLALTGKNAPYKIGFGPFPSGIYHLPFPSKALNVTVEESIKSLESLFKADIDPKSVAAVIIEPIQGEGGFYVAPKELLSKLRALCDEHGIILIADEIQTGFGRTGKMFCLEHFGIEPDIITMAKSLAGGMPLSGVCGKAHIMDGPQPGGLGGTYAGNPLAIASAHAVLDVMQKEGLCDRSLHLGEKLKLVLEKELVNNPCITEVRGIGSMMAIEFKDPITNLPSPFIASAVQQKALASKLLLLTCGVNSNVIRFLYPLTIPDQQFYDALLILTNSIREASHQLVPV
jgi:4-aminobutyrate aminotransferase